MKRIIRLSLLLFSLSLLSSCFLLQNCIKPEGEMVTKVYVMDEFNELELASPIRVQISQADEQRVELIAPQNYHDHFNTELSGDDWEVKFDECLKSTEGIVLKISMKEIEELAISGSGEIVGQNTFEGKSLELKISGSGDMALSLDYKNLETTISGSGNIKLDGEVKKHEIEINGSGDINSSELTCDEVEVEINGSGDVKLNVVDALNVEVNGSGDVYYKGEPTEINSQFNGSGELHKE